MPDVQTLRLATHLVTTTAFGSPSMLVRVLRQKHDIEINFADALALLDQMEAAGIVGPANGSMARDVLMDPARAAAAIDRLDIPRAEAAILRQAADRIAAHPGPHTDELQPDAAGFWWDTRDRDAVVRLLREWAQDINPA